MWDVSTTTCKVSFLEVHKQERAHHTRETCTLQSISSRACIAILNVFVITTYQIKSVHMCIYVTHLLSSHLINADKKTFIQRALNLQAVGRVIDRGKAIELRKQNRFCIFFIICFPLLFPQKHVFHTQSRPLLLELELKEPDRSASKRVLFSSFKQTY